MTRLAIPRRPAPPRAGSKDRRRRVLPFEMDRTFAMRAALAVVVVVFLFLILKVSMIAFGGSSAREAKRIERAIDPSAGRAVPDDTAEKARVAPAR